jgi:cyclic pyranopterin phosphate synthase
MIPARVYQPLRMVDPMGRHITYLRVSLTERCNLRCRYCYGSDGASPCDQARLSDDDLLHLLRAFALTGITKMRFTGGEPLLRPRIADLIRQTSALDGISVIGLTTNGLILEPMLPALIGAGLNRLNISLDTLDRDTYRELTGFDGFERTYASIIAAEQNGAFHPVKVNTVVMRGINDGEIGRFAHWALERRIDLRFIEFMPAYESGWNERYFVGEDEMKNRIGLSLIEVPGEDACPGPGVSYYVPGSPGRISFISTISRDFCGRCNRLRLTSTGKLVGCLFGNVSVDLMPLLHDRANAEEIAAFIRRTVRTPGFRSTRRAQTDIDASPYMRRVGG